jgi:sugar lactone lactonase YvrE
MTVHRRPRPFQRPSKVRLLGITDRGNRLVVAAHELGRLRVQAQEIAKSVEGLGVSIRTTAASCTPTPVPPLFAERDAASNVGAPVSRSQLLSPKRVTKPTTTLAPRFA